MNKVNPTQHEHTNVTLWIPYSDLYRYTDTQVTPYRRNLIETTPS